MQLRGYCVRENFRLPIDCELCKTALATAFEREVRNNLQEYRNDARQRSVLDDIAVWLVNSQTTWGLMIGGIPGTGKTTILTALQRVINTLQLKDPLVSTSTDIRQAGLCIVTAKDICSKFMESQTNYRRFRETSLLALDDLGNEPSEIISYGNLLTPIEDLLEYRYQRRLFTVITTNISPKQIRSNYGDRIASRFNEMMYVVNMPPHSFREPQDGAI